MKINKKKAILIGIATVVSVFSIWNILWLIHYNNFKDYIKNIKDDGNGVYAISDEKENSYSVKMPDYLMFNGNLAIIDKENHALIIWLSLSENKTYGAQISRNNEKYEMLLDEKMQLTGDTNLSNAQEVLDEYKSEITQLYNAAFEFWNLKNK